MGNGTETIHAKDDDDSEPQVQQAIALFGQETLSGLRKLHQQLGMYMAKKVKDIAELADLGGNTKEKVDRALPLVEEVNRISKVTGLIKQVTAEKEEDPQAPKGEGN